MTPANFLSRSVLRVERLPSVSELMDSFNPRCRSSSFSSLVVTLSGGDWTALGVDSERFTSDVVAKI